MHVGTMDFQRSSANKSISSSKISFQFRKAAPFPAKTDPADPNVPDVATVTEPWKTVLFDVNYKYKESCLSLGTSSADSITEDTKFKMEGPKLCSTVYHILNNSISTPAVDSESENEVVESTAGEVSPLASKTIADLLLATRVLAFS